MKLNIRAAAVATALIWGGLVMFLGGLANLLLPGYGQPAFDLAASFYPGYDASASFGQVLIGTAYGLVDGAICGALFAWLYNRFASGRPA